MSALLTTPTHHPITVPAEAAGCLPTAAKALLFNDPRSLALLDRVERIARSEATVLVSGETGTGKELIARHVHARSRRTGPFVAVNCGAIAESIIDAELFGHEAGAFTGANRARAGWFETANHGTLFLDEIGDLPQGLQVKLLRVLQERQVVRLGARIPIALDVRLVAATNIDLRLAVADRRFRSDLYYRLGVAKLHLPPLRDRPGDILPLARHFIGVYAPRLGHGEPRLSAGAESMLLGYAWPGNIRELENVIHSALIVCSDSIVQAHDLSLTQVFDPAAPAPIEAAAGAPPPAVRDDEPIQPAREPLPGLAEHFRRLLVDGTPKLYREVEETLVRTAFAHAGDSQVRAAHVLGVSRYTLRTLLRRHGLSTPSKPDLATHEVKAMGAALPH